MRRDSDSTRDLMSGTHAYNHRLSERVSQSISSIIVQGDAKQLRLFESALETPDAAIRRQFTRGTVSLPDRGPLIVAQLVDPCRRLPLIARSRGSRCLTSGRPP